MESNNVAGSGSDALLIGLGAIPGAWLRLKVVNHFEPMVPNKHWGTFAVNVCACFALGLIVRLDEASGGAGGLTLLLGVGFLGSLSTFSTFIVELIKEARAGRPWRSVALAGVSISSGLLAAAGGVALGGWQG